MPESFANYAGIYRDNEGDLLLIISYSDHLRLLQPSTGDYRKLRQLDDNRFICGSGFDVVEPVASVFEFNPLLDRLVESRHGEDSKSTQWNRSDSTHTEEVGLMSGDMYLSGRLVKPSDATTYPAVVLLHGSGPAEWWWLHAFAEFFASFGVAALTLDKRGIGGSKGNWIPVDFDVLTHDALSAAKYLQQRGDIIADKIGFWGISQGGWLSLRSAALFNESAFVIPVSAPAVTPIEQELYRVEHQLRDVGNSEDVISLALDLYRSIYRVWKNQGEGYDALEQSINRYRNEKWLSFVLDLNTFNRETLTNFKNYDYDPLPPLRQLTCPVLAIFGALDVLVPVEKSEKIMYRELSAQHHPDYTITVFPQADHDIRRPPLTPPGSSPGFVPNYLPTMREWLQMRVG